MNCKPDQLCRVVAAGPNNQALVRTVERCHGCLSSLLTPTWVTEALQHIDSTEQGQVPPGRRVCVPDANLRPLGDEGPEDLTISGELKKAVDRRLKKIIPLVWNPEGEKV
jgi:hypothetical protein